MDNFKVGSNETLISDGWKSLSVSKLLITPWEINKWSETPSHQEQLQHKTLTSKPLSLKAPKQPAPNNQPRTKPALQPPAARPRPSQGAETASSTLPLTQRLLYFFNCSVLASEDRQEGGRGRKEAFKNTTRLSEWW